MIDVPVSHSLPPEPTVGTRIVFELLEPAAAASEAWEQVVALLSEADAQHVQPSEDGPPYLVTAVLGDDADVPTALQRLREMDGVGRADEDAWREMF